MSDESPFPDPCPLVRLFPLPNLVLFPGVVQPLHLFEPRYRQLMADALTDDRRITMALLRQGWEEEYHLQPPIYPTVCIGQIYQEEQLPDGRYNLLLHGEQRARIVEEQPTDRLYRTARVQPLADVEILSAARATHLQRQLAEAFTSWAKARQVSLDPFHQLLESSLSAATLGDVIAFAMPIPTEVKQALLEEIVVERRIQRLLGLLSTPPGAAAAFGKFPPDFSPN